MSNLTAVTPPGKPTHTQDYTPVNLLDTYTPPAAGLPVAATTYDYDLDKNLTASHRPDGIDVTRSYDSAGRLDTLTMPTGTIDYGYYAPDCTPKPGCAPGKLASISGPDAVALGFTYNGPLTTSTSWTGDVAGTVTWTHDNDFRPITEAVSDGTVTSDVAFGYDADSLLTCASPSTCTGTDREELTYNAAALLTQSTLGATTATYTYNTYGELATHALRHGTSTLYSVVYDDATTPRDNLGRVVSKDETLQGTTVASDYAYDDLGRLTDVWEGGVIAEHYEYDANGNRLSLTTPDGTIEGSYDDQDRLLQWGTFEYAYTANGELTSKVDTATGDTTDYTYDALGNLLAVELPDGTLVEYVIDGKSRRVARLVDGVVTQRWVYRDQLNPVAQLNASGALEWQYVYASKPNVPDYAIRVADGAVYRVVSDQLGSVTLVVNVANSSDVLLAARYSAFGEQTVLAGSADWGPFGFAGGRYDAGTGLVRFGARDYDPGTGRWTGKDPSRLADGTNVFVYTGGNPVNAVDVDGRRIVPIIFPQKMWDDLRSLLDALFFDDKLNICFPPLPPDEPPSDDDDDDDDDDGGCNARRMQCFDCCTEFGDSMAPGEDGAACHDRCVLAWDECVTTGGDVIFARFFCWS